MIPVLAVLLFLAAAFVAGVGLGLHLQLGSGDGGGGDDPPAETPRPTPPRVGHCRRQAATHLVLDAQARANCPERPITPGEKAALPQRESGGHYV